MDEKCLYNSLEMDNRTRTRSTIDIDDDLTVPNDSSALILNLCNNIAKKIKDQVVDVIGHVANDGNFKA